MMAANYRHIGCLENRLGRHYSRFSASGPAAPLAAQSLARRKSPNHGSNRRSQARQADSDPFVFGRDVLVGMIGEQRCRDNADDGTTEDVKSDRQTRGVGGEQRSRDK